MVCHLASGACGNQMPCYCYTSVRVVSYSILVFPSNVIRWENKHPFLSRPSPFSTLLSSQQVRTASTSSTTVCSPVFFHATNTQTLLWVSKGAYGRPQGLLFFFLLQTAATEDDSEARFRNGTKQMPASDCQS